MKLLILFIVLQIVNVILSTIRSIVTIKCNKYVSAIVSALYFGFYTVVLIYMNCDLGLWTKVAITAVTNLIGVFVVKYGEELARKDKLWSIRFTVKDNEGEKVINELENKDISYGYGYDARGIYIVFEAFCNSKEETLKVKEIVEKFNAKYFVSESKIL